MRKTLPTDRNLASALPLRCAIRWAFVAAAIPVVGAGFLTIGASRTEAAVLSVGQAYGPPFGGSTCADVAGNNLAAGTPVQAWDCLAGPNQQFELYGYTIYTLGGRLCLDAVGGGTTPGTKVQSYPCITGDQAQWWYYWEGQIKNAHSGPVGDLCLDAGDMNNGRQLVINRCEGYPSQQWQIK
jgi:hypothetical protein